MSDENRNQPPAAKAAERPDRETSAEATAALERLILRRVWLASAASVVMLAVALAANRWYAGRALDAARARTAALGLRMDPLTFGARRPNEAQAAHDAVQVICAAIVDAAQVREANELARGNTAPLLFQRLIADEAARVAEVLVAAAERFAAAYEHERYPPNVHFAAEHWPNGALDWVNFGGAGMTRSSLVQSLCGAATVAFNDGLASEGWRQTLLAARISVKSVDSYTSSFRHFSFQAACVARAANAGAAVAPRDPQRAVLRELFGALDLRAKAHAAILREGALLLHLGDSVPIANRDPWLRLASFDLRDRTRLHAFWAQYVELTTKAMNPGSALDDLYDLNVCIRATPQRYPLVRYLTPNEAIMPEIVAKAEDLLAALLAD